MALSQITQNGNVPGSTSGPTSGPTSVAAADSTANVTTADQYLPEPSTTGMGTFQDALQSAGAYAGTAITAASGVDIGGFQQLIAMQMQAQMEMQQVSMLSNVEKSRHETKMTPIRNIRVG